MAWRFDKFAYTGDMRKMFNQVMIHPDYQVHRFLWRSNDSKQPRVYEWMRLNFGDKPAPDIAAGAIKTLAKASEAKCLEVHMSTLMTLEALARTKRGASELWEGSTPCTRHRPISSQVKAWHSNNKNIDQTDEEFTDFIGHKWNKTWGI